MYQMLSENPSKSLRITQSPVIVFVLKKDCSCQASYDVRVKSVMKDLS
jgi:hypothetical protein